MIAKTLRALAGTIAISFVLIFGASSKILDRLFLALVYLKITNNREEPTNEK